MQNIHTESWEGFPGKKQIKRVGSRAGNPPPKLPRNRSSAPSPRLAALRSQPRISEQVREIKHKAVQSPKEALPKTSTLSFFSRLLPQQPGVKWQSKMIPSFLSSPVKSGQLVRFTLRAVKASFGAPAPPGNSASHEGLQEVAPSTAAPCYSSPFFFLLSLLNASN